jgi:hypothetical protein
MRKLVLLVLFFTITPVLFLFSLLFYLSYNYSTNNQLYYSNNHHLKSFSYAALPRESSFILSDSITSTQGRSEMLSQFLTKYDSPLEPYADYIIEAADKYGLDFRLLPAIAMQESNLCKKIPAGSNNCWGFGIYGTKITRFANYSDAIDTVSKTLATQYRDKGLITPEQIMSSYTPNSPDGHWARSVNHFMEQLQ